MKNVGIVSASEDYIVRVLGYKDAKLIEVIRDNEHGLGLVKFIIEHPSMPEMHEGDFLPIKDTVKVR